MCKEETISEFRRYDKINCNEFDLISGKTEPKQTMALGFLLSKSSNALHAFLKFIEVKEEFNRCVVDCETQRKAENNDRIDILLRLYQNEQPVKAIIVEAKSISAKTQNIAASTQVEKYTDFAQLRSFKDNYQTVTLTYKAKEISKRCISITWDELINVLYKVSTNDKLISNFISYILNIKGNMKFYEEEVVTIPAGGTIEAITMSGIYECEKNKSNDNKCKRSLYFAFRGGNGDIRKLYKLKDLVQLDIDDESAISTVEKSIRDFRKRLEIYKSKCSYTHNRIKYVYILDLDHTIELPFIVRPLENNSGPAYYQLSEIMGACNCNIDNYRILQPKAIKIEDNHLSIKNNTKYKSYKLKVNGSELDLSSGQEIELSSQNKYELEIIDGNKTNLVMINHVDSQWRLSYEINNSTKN